MAGKSFYSKGLRFECTRCGRCCTRHGEHAFVYVNRAERGAIAGYLGLPRAEFERLHCAEADGWTHLRMDGDDCRFLAEDRTCRIYPVRPTQCATWPFWRANLDAETWTGVVTEICPGAGRGPLHRPEEIERLADENDAAAVP